MPDVGDGTQEPLVRPHYDAHFFSVVDVPYLTWQIMLLTFDPFRVV